MRKKFNYVKFKFFYIFKCFLNYVNFLNKKLFLKIRIKYIYWECLVYS